MDPVLVELLDASVTTVCPWILSWLHHWMPQSPPFVLGFCPSCIIRCFSHHRLPLDPVLVESLDASFTTFLRLDPALVESLDASVTTFLPLDRVLVESLDASFTTFLRLDPVLVEPVDASVTTFCPWNLSWLHHQMLQSPPFALGSCPGCVTECFSHHLLPLDPVLVE